MKVRTRKDHKDRIIATVIETTPEEIEDRTGHATGMDIGTIEVAHHDGGITRFFISLRVKRGRAICEIASNKPTEGTSSRRLTGHKWKRGVPG